MPTRDGSVQHGERTSNAPNYEQEEAQAVLADYPPEAQTTAAYDPRNPARSVLEPGVPPGMWKKALIPPFSGP